MATSTRKPPNARAKRKSRKYQHAATANGTSSQTGVA
ncbi:MAG: hypothetical protein J5654_04525 [Victivallales bacterium]|nr:hypothetical protein [Victivallales bacterium]